MKKIIAIVSLVTVLAFSLTGCMTLRNIPFGNTLANADQYTAGDRSITDKVSGIDIDWASGSVTVKPHDADTIEIHETLSRNDISDDERVQSWVDGTTLRIAYQKTKSASLLSINNVKKDLEVLVPASASYRFLDVDAASAEVNIEGIDTDGLAVNVASGDTVINDTRAEKADLSSASGSITMKGCTADTLEIDTASGTQNIDCDASELDFSAASGKIFYETDALVDVIHTSSASGAQKLSFSAAPKKADIHSASGDVEILLPKDAGFSAKIDTASGKVSYDLPMTKEKNRYIAGDGSAEIEVSTASGDVSLLAK